MKEKIKGQGKEDEALPYKIYLRSRQKSVLHYIGKWAMVQMVLPFKHEAALTI